MGRCTGVAGARGPEPYRERDGDCSPVTLSRGVFGGMVLFRWIVSSIMRMRLADLFDVSPMRCEWAPERKLARTARR